MADYNVVIAVAVDDYAFTLAVELGGEGTTAPDGVTVVLRFRWAEQYATWSLRIETPDGENLSEHAVAREGGEVHFDRTNDGAPPGCLQWVGRDTRVKSDLGTRLLLMWTEP